MGTLVGIPRLNGTIAGLVAAGLVATVLLTSCSSPQVQIAEATTSDGTTFEIALRACEGSYEMALDESDDSIVVTFTGDGPTDSDCQDLRSLTLSEPIGTRRLIDGSDDTTVPLRWLPWNRTRYTVDDYHAALEATAACIRAEDPSVDARVVDGPDGPELDASLPDLPDGASRATNPIELCSARHIEPLTR